MTGTVAIAACHSFDRYGTHSDITNPSRTMNFESAGQTPEKKPEAWSAEDQEVFERLASDPELVEELKAELERFDAGLENDRKEFRRRAEQGDAMSSGLL